MSRIEAPNYTQTPNVVFDSLAIFTDCQLRVILAICRKTFGWHKNRDRISLSQLQKMTGLSRRGVIDGLQMLLVEGWVERYPVGQSFEYELIVVPTREPRLLPWLDGSEPTSPELVNVAHQSDPQLVNVAHTQKKESLNKQEIKEDATPSASTTKAIQEKYEELLGYKLDGEWAEGESKAAKSIALKWTPAQLAQAYTYYKADPFWNDQRLTLAYLKKNLPEYFRPGRKDKTNATITRGARGGGLAGGPEIPRKLAPPGFFDGPDVVLPPKTEPSRGNGGSR
jgi:phage replication O-like protein O